MDIRVEKGKVEREHNIQINPIQSPLSGQGKQNYMHSGRPSDYRLNSRSIDCGKRGHWARDPQCTSNNGNLEGCKSNRRKDVDRTE